MSTRQDSSGRAPKGPSEPPFADGNTLSLKHGAFSERMIGPLAAQIRDGLLSGRPHLALLPDALDDFSRAEARIRLLAAWIEQHVLPGLVLTRRLERRADALRSRLGLEPAEPHSLLDEVASALDGLVHADDPRAHGRADG